VLVQDPATRAPIPEAKLKTEYSKTYDYLALFKKELEKRSGYKKFYKKKGAPFYALHNVGPYTLADHKVVWSEVSNSMEAAVVSTDGGRPCIPDHTIILVACGSKKEAHFICGCLNSIPVDLVVKGYIVLHPSPHVLENIQLPNFDPDNKLHSEIAELSKKAHSATKAGNAAELSEIEKALSRNTAKLFGIDADELSGAIEAYSSLSSFGVDADEKSDETVDDVASEE
jgi:hypothetical protein